VANIMADISQLQNRQPQKVLMIAHAFPPFRSVGHSIRVVKFIKYLPSFNWLPVVLTIDDKKEYEDYQKEGSASLLSEVPDGVPIYRAAAGEPSLEFLERERAFSQHNLFSRLIVKVLAGARRWAFRNLALPDRRVVWLPFAVKMGRNIVKSENVDVIFVTCPPHSAVLIGALLKLLTRKPLILDFRDDWIDTPWHRSRPLIVRIIERNLESWAVKTADKVILVTEWSKNAFLKRYPQQPADNFVLISNGVDLEEFNELTPKIPILKNHKFTMLHTGSLNDSNQWTRRPEALFYAIHQLIQQQPDMVERISLTFTGSLPERHKMLVKELGLSAVVKELGFLPHEECLSQMKMSDLLLVINYDGFATLIPGKIYEYWAVGKQPILLLSYPGAAVDFVKQHQLGFTVDPYDTEGVQKAIQFVYHQSKTDSPVRIKLDGIDAYDRRSLTRQLAEVLSMVSTVDNKQIN
jgi:glycosyltransferase involved in cell wall biosynthesis